MRLLLAILFLPLAAWGAATTNTADSVAYADVAAAYALCNDGDTLKIPAGTETWTGTPLTITKAITVMGAGTNLTTINLAAADRPDGRAFNIEIGVGALARICHMSIRAADWWNYVIYAGGAGQSATTNNGRTIRLDHLIIEHGYMAVTITAANTWGVIDHCIFSNNWGAVQFNGAAPVWSYPITAGTTNCMVVETCTFVLNSTDAYNPNGDGSTEEIQSGQGVRFVVRDCYWDFTGYPNNTDQLWPYENHGKGTIASATNWLSTPPSSDTLRGPPIFELYRNTMNTGAKRVDRFIYIRGGSFLCWSNSIVSTLASPDIELTFDGVGYGETEWPGIDQIENSFIWGNTINGGPMTTNSVTFLVDVVEWDRDVFFHAPDDHSGVVTWPDWPGSANAVFTADTAQAYYPYTPLTYPHPLVTAQDGATSRPLALRVGGRATLRSATIR